MLATRGTWRGFLEEVALELYLKEEGDSQRRKLRLEMLTGLMKVQ